MTPLSVPDYPSGVRPRSLCRVRIRTRITAALAFLSIITSAAGGQVVGPIDGPGRVVAALPIGAIGPIDEGNTSPTFFRLPPFIRADFNIDGVVDLSDAIATLNWLFTGGPGPTCENAGDANADNQIDVSDASFLLNWLFTGGVEPPAPGPTTCGVDRDRRALSCDEYPFCSDELPLITHVLNRVTFGPTEALLTRIQTRADLIEYLEEQLEPNLYDQELHEPEVFRLIESLDIGYDPDRTSANAQTTRLKTMVLIDALASDWQLLHVVTTFWNNHFHTQTSTLRNNFFSRGGRGGTASIANEQIFDAADANDSDAITEAEWTAFRGEHPGAIAWTQFRNAYRSDGEITWDEMLQQRALGYRKYAFGRDQFAVSGDMERREYDYFRRHAFGSFRTLLEGCSKSVAQVIYLNGFENTVIAPNENFGREYLELYALGVDHVYTQRDIEEISKIFTGWTAGWQERSLYDDGDILRMDHPEGTTYPINLREPAPFRFSTMENWDDDVYTWAFHFGNPVRGSTDGHDWGRKDVFLPRYGGVDSLGNPIDPALALQIPANTSQHTVSAAMREFDRLLTTTVGLRDSAKFISTKLINLLVTDDLSALDKTIEPPADLVALFEAADTDSDGTISREEWDEPTPDLPNGKPPEIFSKLDADESGRITMLEYQEPDMLLECITAWQRTGGDLREVLRAILFSDEFLSSKFARAKVKTPLENITSALRGLGATLTVAQLGLAAEDIRAAGMEMFDFSDPTGESEFGFDWMHTVGLLERLKYVYRAANPATGRESRATWVPRSFSQRWALDGADRTVRFFTTLLLAGDILDNHHALAVAEYDASEESPIRSAVAFLLALPQFQKQ